MAGEPGRELRHGERLLLPAILLLALGLRLLGLSAYASTEYFYDETLVVRTAQRIAVHHEFRAPTRYWPTGAPYLAGIWCAGVEGLHGALGRLASLPRLVLEREGEPTPTLIVLCRLLMAILGTLSVWLVYLLGSRLGSRAAGLSGALLVAASPLHITKSQEAVTDVPMIFWVLLAIVLAERGGRSRRLGWWAGSGALYGVAVATKYTAAPAVLAIAALGLGRHGVRGAWGRLAVAAAASSAGFLLANPEALMNTAAWWDGLKSLQAAYDRKGLAGGFDHTRLWLLFHLYSEQLLLGRLVTWLAYLGTLRDLVRPRSARFPLALFAGGYLVWYNSTQVHGPSQNFLPPLPFLAPLASALVWDAAQALGRRLAAPRARALVGVLLAGVLHGESLARGVDHQLTWRWPGPRLRVWDWLVRWTTLGTPVLSDGVPLPGTYHVYVSYGDVARITLEQARRSFYLIVPAPRLGALCASLSGSGAGAPGIYVAHREPRDRPVEQGPPLLVLGWVPEGQVVREVLRPAPGDFALSGDSSSAGGLLALRGEGAVARLPLEPPGRPEERLRARLRGAGDASGRREPGPLAARLSLGGASQDLAISENELKDFGWYEFPLGDGGGELSLAYSGAAGGRVYFTLVELLRVLPAEAAPSGLGPCGSPGPAP